MEFAVGPLSQDQEALQENFQVLIFKKYPRLEDCKRIWADSNPFKSYLRRPEAPLSSFEIFHFGGPLSLPVLPVAPVLDLPTYSNFVPVLFGIYLSDPPSFIGDLQAILEITYISHFLQGQSFYQDSKFFHLRDHISRTAYRIFEIFRSFESSFQDLSFLCDHFCHCTDASKVIDRQTILVGSLSLASTWKQDFKLNLN